MEQKDNRKIWRKRIGGGGERGEKGGMAKGEGVGSEVGSGEMRDGIGEGKLKRRERNKNGEYGSLKRGNG